MNERRSGGFQGITKNFDHRSENWMKFDTSSSFWKNIIQCSLLERLGKFVGKEEGSAEHRRFYSVWEGISWQAAVEKC